MALAEAIPLAAVAPVRLTRKDFVSDQTVRWCPGCGDYAILAQMQKVLPDLGIPREKIVFISGIGCSSRFPYYMETYGVHSIHGRAPTLATGLKVANPELSIWVITGDGDGLSIGGNHLVHACRRNVDIKIILFNNRIYGLTKGQYSPTSPQGLKTKSSPMGTVEQPLNPLSVALASEATFIARTIDVMGAHMADVLTAAAKHRGAAFVEIFQNCVIFNDNTWEPYSERQVRDDNNLYLENGKPMLFGKNSDRGIVMGKTGLEVVSLGDRYTVEDLTIHDTSSVSLAWMLSRLEYPMPIGVILDVAKPVFGDALWGQVERAKAVRGQGDLHKLFTASDTWVVEDRQDGSNGHHQARVIGGMDASLDEEYVDRLWDGEGRGNELEERLAGMTLDDMHPRAPILVETSARLDHAISLMQQHNIGCLLVTSADRHIAGILTEGDVLSRIAGQVRDLHSVTVGEYMTHRPTLLAMDTPLVEALHLMSTHGFRHLPIVDVNHLPVGVISVRDVVHFLSAQM
ncbi:MAG: CBS domain-containing protein [Caldilineales bacterium]|nr:CBS domain-containing protein [Caldilineales bacterium]MCW5859849.1 CBS domain-containing protein [Caldilineales bacterium]